MEYEEFRKVLKSLELSMREFSILINTSYGTVKNWGKNGRAVPSWVQSWLDIYIENKQMKQSKETGCEEYKALAKALQDIIKKENTTQTPQ